MKLRENNRRWDLLATGASCRGVLNALLLIGVLLPIRSFAASERIFAAGDTLASRLVAVRVDTVSATFSYPGASSRLAAIRTDTLVTGGLPTTGHSRPFEVRTDTLVTAFAYSVVRGREVEIYVDWVADATAEPPIRFALWPPSPNPSVAGADVRFDLPESADVSLHVMDLAGRNVVTLARGKRFEPGRYSAIIRRGSLPPGAYFVRLVAGSRESVRRLVVLK